MSLNRDDAWAHLCTWTNTESLIKHALAVEIVMRSAAHEYGRAASEEERWGIAGMLHDADYEQWPEEHPKRIVSWVKDQGEPEIAYAISAHYTKWGVPYRSNLDKALLACDEPTGFVVACALVRPDGIASLEPKSVQKKLKDRSFAAKVDREEVLAGADLLKVDFTKHVAFIIDALRGHAEALGLHGRGAA